MTSIVDTHCHIDLPDFDADREVVIRGALDAGVHAMIAIGFNPVRWAATSDLCERFPFVVRAVGIHPNDAWLWSTETEASLRAECSDSNVVAVGEIGLDYYRDRADPATQIVAFEQQLEAARELKLPVIIHQREAADDLLKVLRRFGPLPGVMHCFTGDTAFAEECIDLGLKLGIGGVATFPRSDALRTAVKGAPLNSIIVETDAPYLAPQSQRGRRNTPALVKDAVETIAAVRGAPVHSIAEATTANAVRLFGHRLMEAVESGRQAA